MYTKVHKTSFNGQGLTRKDDCFHGLLKDWTAAITDLYTFTYYFLTAVLSRMDDIVTKINITEEKSE